MQPDDAIWRRPVESASPADPVQPDLAYQGLPPQGQASGVLSSEEPVYSGPVSPEELAYGGPVSPVGPGYGGSAYGGSVPHEGLAYRGLVYEGPPRTTPPPAGWRPPHIIEPAPPRRLPEQDHVAIDDQEARARTLTVGFAIVAGAIMLIALCATCARALF